MRTLSEDLRLRAVRLVVEDGLSLRAVRRRLCIGEATVGRWARQYRRTGSVAAPALVDGAMDGETFLTWMRGMLVKELKPGDVVVMDNLPAHKVAGVREAVEAAGARVAYLPPYSPDFNPIEKAFSKLKALLRKAAARTGPDLHNAVADALDAITPTECANYFTACRYEPE